MITAWVYYISILIKLIYFVHDNLSRTVKVFFCKHSIGIMSRLRTPRGPKYRHWCFTSYEKEFRTEFSKKVVRYIVYQREICEESKRLHYQGYVEFFDQKRLGQVKAILGECHAEPRKGSRTEAKMYCMKITSAIPDTIFEFGEWRIEVNRKRKLCDMLRTDMSLIDLIEETPHYYVMYHRGLEKLYGRRLEKQARIFRKVTVNVLVGPTGSGKTRRATSDPDYYTMPCGDKMWFDGYSGQSILVIDDFYGDIRYSHLLRILDGYFLPIPVKCSFTYALWTKVFITSNVGPQDWYKGRDISSLRRRITRVFHLGNVGDLVLNQ